MLLGQFEYFPFLVICDAPSFCCKEGDNGCEGKCAKESWINDGNPDCKDGSDESQPLKWFHLIFRGVLVNIFGIIGLVLNTLIIVVVRKPELKNVSINLILLSKYFATFILLILM